MPDNANPNDLSLFLEFIKHSKTPHTRTSHTDGWTEVTLFTDKNDHRLTWLFNAGGELQRMGIFQNVDNYTRKDRE